MYMKHCLEMTEGFEPSAHMGAIPAIHLDSTVVLAWSHLDYILCTNASIQTLTGASGGSDPKTETAKCACLTLPHPLQLCHSTILIMHSL